MVEVRVPLAVAFRKYTNVVLIQVIGDIRLYSDLSATKSTFCFHKLLQSSGVEKKKVTYTMSNF